MDVGNCCYFHITEEKVYDIEELRDVIRKRMPNVGDDGVPDTSGIRGRRHCSREVWTGCWESRKRKDREEGGKDLRALSIIRSFRKLFLEFVLEIRKICVIFAVWE